MPWRVKSKIFYFSQEEHYQAPLIYLGMEPPIIKSALRQRDVPEGPGASRLLVRTSQPGIASANESDRSVHICYVLVSPVQPLPPHCDHCGF